MSSAPSQPKYQVYVSPNAGDAGDGTVAKPFGSLAEVAKNFGLDAQTKRLKQASAVQIVSIEAPGKSVDLKKPKCSYYVDTHLLGSDGDGTERDPWPSFASAVDGIIEATEKNGSKLRHGECIEITRRQMFTSSSLERKRMLSGFTSR